MRIGIIRFSSLGDIVLASPALRGLRKTFPDAELVFITTPQYKELAESLPEVNVVDVVRRESGVFKRDAEILARKKWDRIADLQGSLVSARLRNILKAPSGLVYRPPRLRRALYLMTRLKVGRFLPVPERYLQSLASWRVEDDGFGLELSLPKSAIKSVEARWSREINNPFVIIPGARHFTKRWQDNHWLVLVKQLSESGSVAVIGAANELSEDFSLKLASIDNVYNLTGKTSIIEAAEIIKHARCVISGDTGPMHLAAALKIPLVTLFGPTVKEFGFYPFRAERAVVLERNLWCRPCSAHGNRRCPLRHHRCLRDIKPKEALNAISELINPRGSLNLG